MAFQQQMGCKCSRLLNNKLLFQKGNMTKGLPLRKTGSLKFGGLCLTLFLISLLAPVLRSQGQQCSGGPTCYVQYKVSAAELSKCGYQEYTNVNPPRVSIYHHQKITTSHNYTYRQSGTNGYTLSGGADNCWDVRAEDGSYYHNVTDNLPSFTEDDDTRFYPDNPCFSTNVYAGEYTYDDVAEDARTTTHTPGNDCESCGFITTYGYGESHITTDPEYIGGNWVSVSHFWGTNHALGQTSCDGPVDPTGGSDQYSTNTVYVGNYADLLTSLTQINKTYTMSAPRNGTGADYTQSESGSQTWDLSDEYTDAELRGNILGLMPPYPSYWYVPSDDYYDFFNMCAYSVIDGDHINASYWTEDGNAVLQKMQYQFCVPGSQALTQYTVTYDLITYDVPSGSVSVQHLSATIIGTGDPDNAACSDVFEAPAPDWDSSMDPYGGYVFTWVDNVSVSSSGGSSGSGGADGSGGSGGAAGSGSFGSDHDGGGCSSCGVGGSAGKGRSASIFAQFGLGQATNGFSIDGLTLSSAQPSLTLATPAGLAIPTNNPNTEIIEVSGQVRQVTAPQTFVDIVTNNDFSYEIRYYLFSQRGSMVGGLYGVSGSPFVTWKVENPDASTNTYNRIRFTETRGANVRTYDYTYSGSKTNTTWKLDYPGGLREDEWDSAVVTNVDTSGPYYMRYETNVVRVPGGADQFKSLRIYKYLGGLGGYEALVQETIDPDNNPKTTTYSYYEYDRPNGSLKPLKLVTHPDGSWEYYSSYDSVMRPANVYSSFGDEPAPSGYDVPDPSLCRLVEYSYSPISSDDDGTQFPNVPRSVLTYVKNNPVSASYMIAKPGERDDIRSPYPTWYGDPTNLITVTKYFTNGVNSGRIMSVQNPDGTMSLYSYGVAADGSQTNTVSTGQPNSGGTAIVDGAESVTVLGPVGQMILHTEADIASGILTADDIYDNYDYLGRPQQVSHLDGTTEQTQYACCGVDNTTDRDGVVTQYLYDAMKRQVGSSRLNITTTNVLDAAGRTLETIRIGSDNSQIIVGQSGYNVAGELILQTNALGGVTSYIHTNDATSGAKIEITINPDNGTVTNLYYIDGSLKETIGTAVHATRYEYDSGYPYLTTAEIKLNPDGTDTSEAVTNYMDGLGRSYQTIYSDGSMSQSFYNGVGQLWKAVDPDGVTTLYQYNAKGEQEYTAIDIDRNDTIDFNGTDRITRTLNDFTTDNGANVRRSRVYGWTVNGSSSSTLLSTTETSVDGLRSWQTQYRDASTPVTSQSATVFSTGGNRYATNTAPDGSYTVGAYLNGRLSSVTQKDSTGSQLASISYTYDAHGRQYSSTDARNGATTYSYNIADLISSVTSPNPGNGGAAQTTTTYYNPSQQVTNVMNPDGTSVITEYLPTGELLQTHGSRTYPVAYTYDYAGRMKTMKTWQNFVGNSGTATTTWVYDGYRGFLTNKTYDGGSPGPGYTYTSGGRLATRVWARGITTTYNYDNAGGLATIAYSDGVTSSMTNTYDRLGRTTQVGTGNLVSQYNYNLANELLVETNTAGILAGLAVTNGYDAYLRRTDLSALGSGVLSHAAYTYDAGSRLYTVSDGTNNATYSYVANSPLVSQIVFKSNSVTRMTTTKSYDYLNRLLQISNAPSASAAMSFSYTYNSANQRTRDALVDGSYWVYQYDALGQVTSGKKYWADGTPVAGQQFEYGFDDIGNRTQTKMGGDETGSNLRVANYSDNTLNQITTRDVPGYVDIMGIALATNAVAVNGQTAYRKGEYFRKELSVNNGSMPQWTNLTVASPGQTSVTGNKYLPKTQEAFAYDTDGNLTNDGRWTYTWDGENRLVKMNVNTNVGPQYQLIFAYDPKGRRIQKTVASNNVAIYTNKFVYDGWNLIAEATLNNALVRGYMWGTDLSSSMQGAGGIGGLLAMSVGTTNCFFGYDGNGNVAVLVDATGINVDTYEYGPFGEVIRQTGPMAKANPMRFSTKYQDDESDLLYYGMRYLRTSMGGWLSRDPAEEGSGGPNLYEFANNNGINFCDNLGQSIVVHLNCPEDYFSKYGITPDMYDSNGDNHWAKANIQGPTSGIGEILWKMLQDDRQFTALGHSIMQLQRHVDARLQVIKFTKRVHWGVGHEMFNPDYWSSPLGLKAGVDPLKSIDDPFQNPSAYATGCRYGSMLVMLRGIAEAAPIEFRTTAGSNPQTPYLDIKAIETGLIRFKDVTAGGVHPTLNDWVPGDRGYATGTGSGFWAGEWLIYLGQGDNFWGFGWPPEDSVHTIQGWVDKIGHAGESGHRYWPGVGLEK
jgi:RHS repeat-associated protein